jgi:hypothetical protein
MAKFQSPLLGYNNNVRHKNRVFHIQTEDSGVNHPHIITHLFMDGGRILKSVKKSYAEHVGADGMSETVRGLMKEQHKAMFIALRDGQFDHLVDPGAAKAAAAAAESAAALRVAAGVAESSVLKAAADVAESVVTAAAQPASSDVAAVDVAAAPAVGAAPAHASTDVAVASIAAQSGPPTSPDPPRLDIDLAPSTFDETKRPAKVSVPPPRLEIVDSDHDDVPMTTRQPADTRPDAIAASAKSPSGRELTLDFDALERAAQDAVSPSLFHSSDLPPPPKNLFAKEPGTGGAYRAVETDPRHDARAEASGRSDAREETAPRAPRSHAPPPPPSTRGDKSPQPGRTAPSRAPASRPGEARYAPARPAAIFGSTQRPPPQSIFSDELVSDKSLDEVILSYLAEDLEPPRRK